MVVLLVFMPGCGDGDDTPEDAAGGGGDGRVVVDDAGQPVNPPDAGQPPDAAVTISACPAGGDFPTIQAAIDAAPAGARIEICAGTYLENVILDKPLAVVGLGEVIVDGGDRAPAFTVQGVTGAGGRASIAHLVLTHGRGGALGGGGLLVDGSLVDASDLVIHGNRAGRGGGVAIHGGDARLLDTIVRENQASDRGGGVYVAGDATLRRLSVLSNTSVGKGGGIFVDGFAPIVGESMIALNSSGADGGGAQAYSSTAVFESNVFDQNYSLDDAGGLRLHISQVVVRNNTFTGNTAGDGDGGGIKVSHDRSEITDNLFADNVASGSGGGIEVDDDQSLLARNTFRSNEARRGGGIHAAQIGSPAVFEDNILEGNVAELRGGGVLVENSPATGTVTLLRHTFVDNSADRGASFAATNAPFVVTNSLMTGGSAASSGSAIYISSGASGTLAFLVVVDNASDAVALRFIDSTVTIHSSFLQGDVQVDGALPDWRYTDVFPAAVFTGMDDPAGSGGNLTVDPLFTDDYHLAPGSPLIDHGDPAFSDLDGTTADMGMFGGPDAP